MPNTVIALKKSSTPSAVPSNLANGELAINFADGKIFYKNVSGSILAFSAAAAADSFGIVNANGTLITAASSTSVLNFNNGNNITIVGDAINNRATIGLRETVSIQGDFTSNRLISTQSSGSEGGEIVLALPPTGNNNLNTSITIDVWQDRIRFFETGGSNRGAFINVAAAATGVGTDILASVGSSSDTFARNQANAAFAQANTANATAIAAFAKANANNGIGNSLTTQVLFNDAGISNGSNSLTFNKTTGTLNVSNINITGTAAYITANSIAIGDSEVNSIIVITSTTSDQIIDSFANTTWRSAHYHITMNAGTDFQTTQISLLHDNFNSYITEYGTVANANNLGVFSTSVVSGSVRLNVAPRFAATTIRMFRTANK